MKMKRMTDHSPARRCVCRSRAALASLLAAAVLAAGCAEHVEEPLAPAPVAVDFTIDGIEPFVEEAWDGAAATRAGVAPENLTTVRLLVCPQNSTSVEQEVTMAFNSQTGLWSSCTVDASGAFQAAADPSLTLTPGDYYDIYALSPAYPLDASKTKLATIAADTDYAVSKTSVTVRDIPGRQSISLTDLKRLNHSFKVTVTPESGISSYKVNSLTIEGFCTGCADVPFTATSFSGLYGSATASKTITAFTVNGSGVSVSDRYIAMLAPRLLTFTFDITANGHDYTFVSRFVPPANLDGGKVYSIGFALRKMDSGESYVDLNLQRFTWTGVTVNPTL